MKRDMDEIHDLEHRLTIARERLQRAIAALAPKHKGGEWEEYRAAEQDVLGLERKLAAARGDEYAETLEFPVRWDAGAPMPHLMKNDHRALLAFLLSEPDPNWDGTYVTVKSPANEGPEPLGLVEFTRCISAKLGAPNDEVFEGHPLNGKGLEAYGAQRVVNSRWLKEVEKINSVHRMYRPESWRDLHHFIFWFHDSTFECLAESYKVETHRISMKALLGIMVERLIS
jgi:hypothetical protein